MQVNMLGDRVLIKVDAPEEKRGSLYIPDTGKDMPQAATVVAVGPGKFTENGFFITPVCEPGDRVLFPKYSGATIEIDEESYLIVHDTEILCKLREEEELSNEQ